MSTMSDPPGDLHNVWQCEYCDKNYKTEQEAVVCERICLVKQNAEKAAAQKAQQQQQQQQQQHPEPTPNKPAAAKPDPTGAAQNNQAQAKSATAASPKQNPPFLRQANEVIHIDDSSSDDDDDEDNVINLDNVRQLASTEQLVHEPVSGLHVSGSSNADALMFDDLDPNDPVIQQQQAREKKAQQQKEKEPDGKPAAVPAPLQTKPATTAPSQPKPAVPAPLQPKPATVATSAPSQPKPTASAPLQPKPTAPAPLQPKAAIAAPSQPKPIAPTPSKPTASTPSQPKAPIAAPSQSKPTAPTPSQPKPAETSKKPAAAPQQEPLTPAPQQPKPAAPAPSQQKQPEKVNAGEERNRTKPRSTRFDVRPDDGVNGNRFVSAVGTTVPEPMETDQDVVVSGSKQSVGNVAIAAAESVAPQPMEIDKPDAQAKEAPAPQQETLTSKPTAMDTETAVSSTPAATNQKDLENNDGEPTGSDTGPMSEESAWDTLFQQLVAFRFVHKHTEIPEGSPLFDWCKTIRETLGVKRHIEGNLSDLEKERVDKLDNLGFDWSRFSSQPPPPTTAAEGSSSTTKTWDEMFQLMVSFKEKTGRVDLQEGEQPELQAWWNTARQSLGKRKREGNLTREELDQISRLENTFHVKWLVHTSEPGNKERAERALLEGTGTPVGDMSATSRIESHSDTGDEKKDDDSNNNIDVESDYEEFLAMEESLMRDIDDDITMAEEAALMDAIDEDIRNSEERRKKRPRYALDDQEDCWELDTAICRKPPKPNHPSPSNVEIPKQIRKLLPRRWNGRSFIDEDDIGPLMTDFLPTECIKAWVDPVTNDPNTWLLTVFVETNLDMEEFLGQLKEWLLKMRQRFNVALLRETGTNISFEIGDREIGAKLHSFDGSLLLAPQVGTNGENCTIVAVREGLKRGGILLVKVNGVLCNTMAEFQEQRQACKEDGRPLPITGLQPRRNGPQLANASSTTNQSANSGSGAGTGSNTGPHNRNGGSEGFGGGVDSSSTGSAQSRGDSAAALAAYTHFKTRFNPVALIDFKGANLHVNAVTGSMWQQHKTKFGKDCHNKCGCVRSLGFLTQNVIRDNLILPNKWDNVLKLKEGDNPVGFSRYFVGHFLDLLVKEYPDADDDEILDRLLSMWKIHEQMRMYGIKCHRGCECVQGWEDVFHKGKTHAELGGTKPKPRADVVVRPAVAGRVGPAPQPEEKPASSAGAKTTKEYEVSFDTNEPMGQYYENVFGDDGASRCIVKSICLKTVRSRDSRIQMSSTVLAVIDRGGGRTPIHAWQHLKKCYCEAKEAGQPLRVVFKNQVLSRSEMDTRISGVRFADDWTSSGKFRGRSSQGWAGGANHYSAKASKPQAVSRTDTNNEKAAGERDQDSQWEKKLLDRPLVRTEPKHGILRRGPSDHSKKISWSSTEKKEWQYEIEAPTNEFFVPREKKPPAETQKNSSILDVQTKQQKEMQQKHELTRAVESGSFLDALKMFDSGLASGLTFRELSAMRDIQSHRDFALKNVILKVFLTALVAAKNAASLTKRRDFQVQVQEITLSFSDEYKAKSEKLFIVMKTTGHSYGRAQEDTELVDDISFEKSEKVNFAANEKSSTVRHNQPLDPKRTLEIEANRGSGEDSVLGFLSLPLQKLSDATRKGRRTIVEHLPLIPSSTDLKSGVITIRFERFSDTQKTKQDRREWSRRVGEICGWIQRFNEDLARQKISDRRFSYEVPIAGTTLLHTAVMLAEETLVKRLLKEGARVNPSIVSLAEGGREDGFSREPIAKILSDHKNQLALASQDESPSALNSWEIRAVDEAYLVNLGNTHKTECFDFRSGRCTRGRTCPDVHFYRDGRIPQQPPRYEESQVQVICKENQHKVKWYTSRYIEGNELWVAHGAGGVQCEVTGVWWYRDEQRARRAARAAVDGFNRDSLS